MPSVQEAAMTLKASGVETSEQLVKLLRTPQPNLNKVELATLAWEQDDFFVSQKAELISRWVLEYLCSSLKVTTSGKARAGALNRGTGKGRDSGLDLNAWKLLHSVIASQIGANSSEADKRAWLTNLSATQPVLQLTSAIAENFTSVSWEQGEIAITSTEVLESLLPPSSSRVAATNIESVTDTIASCIKALSTEPSSRALWCARRILRAVVPVWTIALQYGSNSKRNHQYFLTNCTEIYVRALWRVAAVKCTKDSAVQDGEDSDRSAVLDLLEQIGSESLFTNDALRLLLQAVLSTSPTPSLTTRTESIPIGVIAKFTTLLEPKGVDTLAIDALKALPTLCSLLHARLKTCDALSSILSSSAPLNGATDSQQLLVRRTMLLQVLVPLSAKMSQLAQTQTYLSQEMAHANKGLLKVIEENDLYMAGSLEDEAWRSLLGKVFQDVHNNLQAAFSPGRSELFYRQISDHFDSLSSLWRLEQTIVEPHLISLMALAAVQPVVTESLFQRPRLEPPAAAALAFFHTVAEAHAKFRTFPTLISTLLCSMIPASDLIKQSSDVSLQHCLFVSDAFLTDFNKFCRDAVMPVQVSDTINRLLEDSVHMSLVDNILKSSSSKKKQRREYDVSRQATEAAPKEMMALVLQLHLIAQVLQSVPLLPTLRDAGLQSVQSLYQQLLLRAIDIGLNCDERSAHCHVVHQIAASALRARQSLLSGKWRYDPSEPVRLDGSLPTESLPFLENDLDVRADQLFEIVKADTRADHHVQLRFTAFQAILQRAERDTLHGDVKGSFYYQQVADAMVMTVCEGWKRPTIEFNESAQGYTGLLLAMDTSRALREGMWASITTRWAPLLDQVASQEVLAKLAENFFGAHDSGSLEWITFSALKDASFLELSRWRKSLIDKALAVLSDVSLNSERESSIYVALKILSDTPMTWIPKAQRSTLLVQLLTVNDAFIAGRFEFAGERDDTSWESVRGLIARFLADRESAFAIATSKDSAATLLSLLAPYPGQSLRFVSNSLMAFQNGFRQLQSMTAEHNSVQDAVSRVLLHLEKCVHDDTNAKTTSVSLHMKALLSVYELLHDTDAVSADLFTHMPSAQSSIRNIQEAMKDSTTDDAGHTLVQDLCIYYLREFRVGVSIMRKRGAKIDDDLGTKLTDLLSPLCSIVSVLGPAQKSSIPELITEYLRAVAICGALSDADVVDATGESSQTPTGWKPAPHVCLGFAALHASTGANVVFDDAQSSSTVARIIEKISSLEYDEVLGQLLRLLEPMLMDNKISQSRDSAALLEVIGLVLCNGPQATSRIARTHLSNFLGMLVVSASKSNEDANIQLSVVSTVEKICSSKAMLLRLQDVAIIMQLFEAIFAPSMSDNTTPPSTYLPSQTKKTLFMGIVASLGSIIRMRQDLMLSLLPQLTALLSRMCSLFRRLRSTSALQGSGLLNRQLRRDMPVWLDPMTVEPLQAAPEGRAFSRLLAGLTVKNIALGSTGGAKKAESLGRPFSKHATHVLVAYLRTLTSANTTVPSDVRTELEPGMLALCSMIGYHQRDSAMASMLDSAGKTLLKRLWKTFEAQRYKGE